MEGKGGGCSDCPGAVTSTDEALLLGFLFLGSAARLAHFESSPSWDTFRIKTAY